MKKASILKTLGLGALIGVATSTPVDAQEQTVQAQEQTVQQNRIYSENLELTAIGDGVLLKDIVHQIPLKSYSMIKLDDYFGLRAFEGDISYEVIDARKGLETIRTYLRKEDLNERERAYLGHIEAILAETPESDRAFISSLNDAVKDDGVIDAWRDGLAVISESGQHVGWNIGRNRCVIIARSPSGNGYEGNSLPILTEIIPSYVVGAQETRAEVAQDTSITMPRTEAAQDTSETTPREGIFAWGRRPSPTDTLETLTQTETAEAVTDTSLIETQEAVQDSSRYLRREARRARREEKPSHPSLITNYIFGEGFEGTSLGLRQRHFGLLLNYSEGENEVTRELSVPLSNGRTGVGREEERDLRTIGISAELYPLENLFVGAGIGVENYTTEVKEDIVSIAGDVLKTNINSKSEKETSKRFYAGIEIPLSKRVGLRAIGGHSTRRGNFGGVGLNIRLGKRGHRK